MQKHFFSHLVSLEEIWNSLQELELSQSEKAELYELAHSHMHHTIMDEILSQLSDENKQVFLDYLEQDEHQKIWEHLNKNIESIEDRIKQTSNELIAELKNDISETK